MLLGLPVGSGPAPRLSHPGLQCCRRPGFTPWLVLIVCSVFPHWIGYLVLYTLSDYKQQSVFYNTQEARVGSEDRVSRQGL